MSNLTKHSCRCQAKKLIFHHLIASVNVIRKLDKEPNIVDEKRGTRKKEKKKKYLKEEEKEAK